MKSSGRLSASPESAASCEPPQYPIESVDKALRILLLLGEQSRLRLMDVSEHLGVAQSTAHRLMAMLQYRGFVQQDPESRGYQAGPALTSVAFRMLRQIDVRERVHPILLSLSERLGETVHLARLDGRAVTFMDSVESRRAVRVGSRMGLSMQAHCTSSGKAMLAERDDLSVRRLYEGHALVAMTDKSIHDIPTLLGELARIRERGFATSDEESEDGVASVAIALGVFGGLPYALNVAAPRFRMQDAAIQDEIAAELTKAITQVEALFL